MATAEMLAQRVVFGETLVALADAYPDLLVLDGDLANSTRADIFNQARPDRFLEMGIAEQNMAGVAAGLATVGFVPWISSFAAFIASRDLDQIRVVVAQPNLNVKLAAGYTEPEVPITSIMVEFAISRSMRFISSGISPKKTMWGRRRAPHAHRMTSSRRL